jgi:hypothetical protein
VFGAVAYRGDVAAALRDAANGATVPMWTRTITASKDGNNYTVTQVGGSPNVANPGTTTVNVLVVPVIVHIGSTVFDPTAANACITGRLTPLAGFQGSPPVNSVIFDGKSAAGHASLINRVAGGAATYVDAFRRAEYWQTAGGTAYHTGFNVTYGAAQTITAVEVKAMGGGNVISTNCAPLGVLPTNAFEAYVQSTLLPRAIGATDSAAAGFHAAAG